MKAASPRESNHLEALAAQITAGKAVFLVGAGFSIDSENLSAGRLIGRLLARMEAIIETLEKRGKSKYAKWLSNDMSACLGCKDATLNMLQALIKSPDRANSPKAKRLQQLLEGYAKPLKNRETKQQVVEFYDNWKEISSEYYKVNSWFCSAFGDVLAELNDLSARPGTLSDEINKRENELRKPLEDDAPFRPIEPRLIQLAGWLRANDSWNVETVGKMLFLDTQGFDDPQLMAGEPEHASVGTAFDSYHAGSPTRNGIRLRPRHEVLARWAREGYLANTLTTNFDQLLEGAYRLTGMDPVQLGPNSETLAARVEAFSRIGCAEDFLLTGGGCRHSRVVKFHGCAGRYRDLRETWMKKEWKPRQGITDEVSQLLSYTRGLVFTFREILYWRQDGWARDLVRSELRTKSAVLAGFSGNDPVLHDTFRGVYEEVASIREASGQIEDSAPAYYFARQGNRDLAPMEILQASRRAAGMEPLPFHQHEAEGQQLQFAFKNCGFPDYDHVFTILQHHTQRQRQAEFLKLHLEKAVDAMHAANRGNWKRTNLMEERRRLQRRFAKLIENESVQIDAWIDAGKKIPRAKFYNEVIGWTHTFIPSLLREWAISHQRSTDDRRPIRVPSEVRRHLYFPIEDAPVWTARCVIAELAIRQMAALALGVAAEDGLCPDSGLTEIDDASFHAGLRFADRNDKSSPRAPNELRIAWSRAVKETRRRRLAQAPPRSLVVWRGIDGVDRSQKTPSQKDLWEFATADWTSARERQFRIKAKKFILANSS